MQNKISSIQRSEFKYLLSYADAMSLSQRLAALLNPDPHSKQGAYRVKSLYFDSLNQIDYTTKISGENSRKKIRLRLYDESSPTVKLEWKAKEGIFQQKTSMSISREDAQYLMQGNYGILLSYEVQEAAKFYHAMVLGHYTPAVLVEYDRFAFQHSQYRTRITFDSNIKSSELSLDLFSRNIPYQPIIYDQVVLEVKYNQKLLGFLSECLKDFQLTNLSLSKYCVGRHIFQDYI